MKRAPVAFTLAAAFFLGGAIASAQSLAEIAKKESERRKVVKGPGKVYTNDDLKPYPAPAPAPGQPSPEAGAAPPVPAPGDQPAPAVQPAPAPTDEVKEEAYWKGLITAARIKLERDESFLEALQSRVNALTNDFYARDDPAQRDVIWSQRTKALDEMERLKKEIADGTNAVARIKEDARRAGVPPGWLR